MWLRLWSSPISASLTQMQFNVIVKHDGIYILLSLLVLFSIEFCFKILFQSTASSIWPLCSRCINIINSWSLGLHHCRLVWAQAGQKRRHGTTKAATARVLLSHTAVKAAADRQPLGVRDRPLQVFYHRRFLQV